MKNHFRFTALVLLAGVARAASAQAPRQLPPAVITDSLMNSITVQNDRNTPVVIYLSSGNTDRRLGVVEPFTVAMLALPEWAVTGHANVRFVARSANAAVDLSTDAIKLQPPGRIGMVIPAISGVAAEETMSVALAPEDAAEATITIDNPRSVAVTIFATKGPFDLRVGEVAPKSRATLHLPKSLVGSANAVTLLVRPRAGMDLATNILHVQPGDHLALRVPSM